MSSIVRFFALGICLEVKYKYNHNFALFPKIFWLITYHFFNIPLIQTEIWDTNIWNGEDQVTSEELGFFDKTCPLFLLGNKPENSLSAS